MKFKRKFASITHIKNNSFENVIKNFDAISVLSIGLVALVWLWIFNFFIKIINPTITLFNFGWPFKLLIITMAVVLPVKLLTDSKLDITGKSIAGVVILDTFVIFLLWLLPKIGLSYNLFSII